MKSTALGKNKHIGSNFDDFLKEEGLLEKIEETVAKKVKQEKIEPTDTLIDFFMKAPFPEIDLDLERTY